MTLPSGHAFVRWGLAALGFGFFSVFVGVLHAHVRGPGRSFDGVAGVTLGLIAPVVLGSLLVGSWRWSPSSRARLGAALGIAALVLVGIELSLGGEELDPSALPDLEAAASVLPVSADAGARFDTRTRAEVVMALRERGLPAVINFRPARHALRKHRDGTLRPVISIDGVETLPMGGIPDAATVWCNESGLYEVYRSDLYGFRNPPQVWRLDTIEVAVLGNSFAMGGCVPTWKAFADRIREAHPGTLNLGMGHHGPLFALATLKEYLGTLRPRIVLWAYEEDHDLPALDRDRRIPLLMRYLEGNWTQRLMSRQREIAKAVVEEGERELRSQLRALQHTARNELLGFLEDTMKLRRVRRRLDLQVWAGGTPYAVDAGDLQLLRRILQEAREATTAWGGRLVFVYLPARTRYTDAPSVAGQARDRVLDLVARLHLPVVDMHPVFQRHRDPLSLFPFRRFQHYTERGHELIAREIERCLARPDFVRGSTVCPSPTSTVRK